MIERIPIILDVDTGIDDALALAFAVRSPEAELVAVTTLAGNVSVELTTANTLAVLDWLGRSDVPVHQGASRPLIRPHRDATYFHAANGLGGADLPASGRALGPDRGPAAVIRLARERPREVVLVCLGPLTNLAIALNVAPELPTLLGGVVVMGGAFEVPGNITPHAEYNIFADPEAAQQVFSAGLPHLTAIGLDVTHQTTWSRESWEATREAVRDGPDADRAAGLAVGVCRQAFAERGLAGTYLHDPLALAVALDPDLVRCENVAIAVETDDERRGQTRVIAPGTTRVALAVDAESFLNRFHQRLSLVAT